MDMSRLKTWNDVGVGEAFTEALKAVGLEKPSEIQKLVIPDALLPSSTILCAAETGKKR